MYLEQAIGSSQDPGTDCTTIFDSFTPEDRSLAFVPARRGSIIAASRQYLLLCHGFGEQTCVPASVHDTYA